MSRLKYIAVPDPRHMRRRLDGNVVSRITVENRRAVPSRRTQRALICAKRPVKRCVLASAAVASPFSS
jgi:hypothetical protein